MSLSVEYIELAALRAYSRNARTHSPEQVAQLVNSIQEFGFTNPVLIDEEGERRLASPTPRSKESPPGGEE